jgi:hypothetical protein
MPKKSFDALVLFILVIARVQIDTLADNVLPNRLSDVRRLVESWWPAWSLDGLDHPQTDPVTMMLVVTAFGLLVIYVLIDVFFDRRASASSVQPTADRQDKTTYRLKLILIYGIIGLLVFGKTILLMNLRHQSVPWSYSHDGGVIQTEVTIDYFLQGLNPYVEDYVNTPMAEWGINEYRTALYHYPYLPWIFIFSTPFYLLSQVWPGWYDQRIVYLLLFALTLILTQALVKDYAYKLLAVMLVGLNPIMAVDIIFGLNDPFVLFWIVLALWLLKRTEGLSTANSWGSVVYSLLASVALGLACASKPTAWFLVPFWFLFLLQDRWGDKLIPPRSTWLSHLTILVRRGWSLPVFTLLIIGPWIIWDPAAMYDDVWRWSAGQGETGYQIWGWGASNYVLAFGLLESRFEYWPFIIPQAIIGLPLLLFLLRRQAQHNAMNIMLSGYVVFLFIFFYLSRFMQPNYLGFLGSVLVLAYCLSSENQQTLKK